MHKTTSDRDLQKKPLEEVRWLDMGLNQDAIGLEKLTYRTREFRQKVKAAKRRLEKFKARSL